MASTDTVLALMSQHSIALMEACGALIGGVGGSFAFVLGAWVYARQSYDARRDHATHVSAWLDTDAREGVAVFNSSRQAIHGVVVDLVDPDTGAVLAQIGKLSVIPPDERMKIPFSAAVLHEGRKVGRVAMAVTFTDRAGRRWTRSSTGKLRRAK